MIWIITDNSQQFSTNHAANINQYKIGKWNVQNLLGSHPYQKSFSSSELENDFEKRFGVLQPLNQQPTFDDDISLIVVSRNWLGSIQYHQVYKVF